MTNFYLKIGLLILNTLFFSLSNAQIISKSPIYTDKKWYIPNIVGEDDKHIFVLSTNANNSYYNIFRQYNEKKYQLECYDKETMIQKYKVLIVDEEISKNVKAELAKIIFTQNKFIVFYEYYEKISKDDQHYKLYAKTLEKSTGKLADTKKILLDISIEKKSRTGNFDILQSEDHSKIFINHKTYYDKLQKSLQKYILLDDNLTVLYESKQDVYDKIPNYLIDNDGSLQYVKHDGKSLIIGSLDANKKYKKQEQEIKLNTKADYYINSLSFSINKNNELVCTGIYGTKAQKTESSYYYSTGSFYISINHESKKIKQNQINTFSTSFLDSFKSSKDLIKRKGQLFINDFYGIIQHIHLANGGTIVIGEKYYHYSNSDKETIQYGDMIVMNFTKEGKMEWVQHIPKYQLFFTKSAFLITFSSIGMRGMRFLNPIPPTPHHTTKYFSYYAGIENDNLVIRYNDTDKNLTDKNDVHSQQKAFKKPEKAVIHKYEINLKTGKYTSTLDTKFLDLIIYLVPSKFYQKDEISDSYIFAQKGRKYQFIKLEYK